MSEENLDLVVVGSGAAGLTAALTASRRGLRTMVLEKDERIGGTSARSSGAVWVPDNHLMRAAGFPADRDAAERYLAGLTGTSAPDAMWHVFLDAAPRMLAELAGEAGIGFRPFLAAPDYRQDIPGAATGGRPLEPLPFDGRILGADFGRVADPLPELVLFGGMMITRSEAMRLIRAERSPSAMALGARLVARYAIDRLSHRRGTRLVLGNALVARLYHACRANNVRLASATTAHELIRTEGRIAGIRYSHQGKAMEAICPAVILAGGGFPSGKAWRDAQFPQPVAQHTPAAPGCTGSTIELGLAAGGTLGPSGIDNAFWFPSSLYERRDGSLAVYPHIVLDRAKPGMIAIDQSGKRFTNEAASYHEFVRAMYRANSTSPAIPAWLICDRKALRRYGLGVIRPRTPFVARYEQRGYLKSGTSIEELAQKIDVPADRLGETISRFNSFADCGVDADFHRGENVYDLSNGDPQHRPNPCLGRLGTAPFFAVQLHPTPLGTSRGLRADACARVLDTAGLPIDGLYVCGNDMQSAFCGEYPGAGAQLGQGMTFGWLAGRHAAETLNCRTNE